MPSDHPDSNSTVPMAVTWAPWSALMVRLASSESPMMSSRVGSRRDNDDVTGRGIVHDVVDGRVLRWDEEPSHCS